MADGASVSALSTIKLHIEARDCDGLPIRYTRADIQFSFNNQLIAVTWNRGSNEYTAVVPTELTAQPGVYALVVTASKAWNKTAGQMTRCELLSRTIEVTTALDIQSIIIGAVTGALLLILGVAGIYMVSKHRHRATQLFVSFLRGETLLALKVLMELLDISGDSTPLPYFCPCPSNHPASGCIRC
jgi:hypothetical protein